MQGCMHAAGIKWTDFCIWTKKDFEVIRIRYDENFFYQKMYMKLKEFYYKISPEILQWKK